MSNWYAIKTWHDFQAEEYFRKECADVFFPKRIAANRAGIARERAFIPHLLFVKAEASALLAMESLSREDFKFPFRFWIYRYPKEDRPQVIPEHQIHLIRLLTSDGGKDCEIFRNTEMAVGTKVRITGGKYEGYEGVVRRVNRRRHVLVRIEGVCVVMLPLIHPDFLAPINNA